MLFYNFTYAQNDDAISSDSLKFYELKLKAIGDSMLDGKSQMARVKSVVKFIPLLVKTLKLDGSFYYRFDTLKFMYTFTPSDEKFRLYNWNVKFADGTFRYYAVLQMNPENGFKLIPLYDKVEKEYFHVDDTTFNSESWYGAQYYQLFHKRIHRKDYYFMLGWDGYKLSSTRKIIEVLSFDEDGKPVFGAPLFKIGDELKYRMIFEFKPDAIMTLKYDPERELIIYDNLVPPNENSKGKYFTYVPDGTYDFLKFNKRKDYWEKEEMLFNEKKDSSPAEDAGNIK